MRFFLTLLYVEVGVFGGVIVTEYFLYLCGRKNTLFHESWKTILR